MGFNIGELVQSTKYRKFIQYLYGWGASIVLLGALFKLQHWPGAGLMLTLGMSVEAVIFFFSAFEPLPTEYDWTIVYPELAGVTDDVAGLSSMGRGGSSLDPGMLENVITSALMKAGGVAGPQQAAVSAHGTSAGGAQPVSAAGNAGALVFTQKFNDMLEKAEIGPELFSKVSLGLNRLSEASNGIGRISDAVKSSEAFTQNLQRAGNAVGKFAESYENSGALMVRSAQVLSQSLEGTAMTMDASSQSFSKQVQEAVSKVGVNLTAASGAVEKNVSEAGKELAGLNKSLQALNEAQAQQVKNVQQRLQESDKLSAGVEDMMKRLMKTVEDSQKYSQSVAKLTENVSQLNTIYGNMLSAMGSVVNGR